jgi:N-hydroxyarylamine O-acetyltransferase
MTELTPETVNRYLERMGLSAAPAADLDGLRTLMQAHLSTVPFEALDVFVGRRVHTSLDHSVSKIVDSNRGGWCYENNGSFGALLRSLGFDVLNLGAAVLLDGPTTVIDHLCLEVTLDGSWLVDVGFGDSFTVPLDLNRRGPQDGLDATYELIDSSQGLTLTQHDDAGVPVPQYRFRRVHHELVEFTGASDALQDNPDLHWSNKRFATRLIDGGPDRVTLLGDRLKIRRDGVETEEPVADDEWVGVLQEWFSIEMPSVAEG